MYRFWLDLEKEHEEAIADMIDELKKKRLFAKTVRDGIRLICDLRADKRDVLKELFPQMNLQTQTASSDRVGGYDMKLLEAINKLADSQNMKTGSVETTTTQEINQIGGFKQIAAPVFDDDEDDDDLLLVKKDLEAGGKANQNFINSLMALQGN